MQQATGCRGRYLNHCALQEFASQQKSKAQARPALSSPGQKLDELRYDLLFSHGCEPEFLSVHASWQQRAWGHLLDSIGSASHCDIGTLNTRDVAYSWHKMALE